MKGLLYIFYIMDTFTMAHITFIFDVSEFIASFSFQLVYLIWTIQNQLGHCLCLWKKDPSRNDGTLTRVIGCI